jgi:DNA replication protein DnaC
MEKISTIFKEKIDVAFTSLSGINGPHVRQQTNISFGDKEIIKPVFIECFNRYDRTVKNFQWLPEYDLVLDWLSDNNGKGLYLTGDCGRGKSNIIYGVILPLYKIVFRSFLPGFHATQLPEKVSIQFEDRYTWNYEILLKWKIAYIDEIGTERMVTAYGEKFEPFNAVLNEAEQKLNLLILSSNLSGDQFLNRYGDRAMDRIKRLCKIVPFAGSSLRT